MKRRCSRCPEEGTAVMRFEYGGARIWIEDLDGIVDPGSGYPFCDRHAASMTPPIGWSLDDRRNPMLSLFGVEVS